MREETLDDVIHNLGPVPKSYKVRTVARYVMNVLIAIDELGNALSLGNPHETISSRAYRAREHGSKTACVFCKFLTALFWLIDQSPDHCLSAYDKLSAINE